MTINPGTDYFLEISNLQFEILKTLRTQPTASGSIDGFRSDVESAHHDCLQKLRKIQKLLVLMDFNLQNDTEIHLDPIARLEYAAQIEKVKDITNYLKTQVRSFQLQSLETEREIAHQIRLKKFTNSYFTESEEKSEQELRDELFANRQTETANQEKSINAQILAKNASITHSLKHSRQLIESSILQSELNIEELTTSTKDMHQLADKYSNFNVVLQNTGKLVKFINSQNKKDRRNIMMALAFFTFCCVWVIWRRILRRPVMLLVWVVLKLLGVTRIFGKVFGSRGDTVTLTPLSQVIASTTEVLASTTEVLAENTLQSVVDAVTSSLAQTVEAVQPDSSEVVTAITTIVETVEEMMQNVNDILDELVGTEAVQRAVETAAQIIDEL
ncbi:hypothetical protein BABINDRAFT_168668 [Babjeviella inositovora NRRL Y-12698]|uniref:Sec20 C-terminal domain-containing protein n=1 Tax=Babjeviella inositovora NRRL Y-12698 TaxID=984486 RepID=A0A1E3QK72_9ASCO|nr:uncharacterized protein BABINDRAFT_168668 [Babjeviella inositovora NRRL Y-12698]ODQ78091.1 hypothetical protein BABINDRAFT_168668 [Babjeviella inositovora NRRL Y-12698]